jgi:hypothetical protein
MTTQMRISMSDSASAQQPATPMHGPDRCQPAGTLHRWSPGPPDGLGPLRHWLRQALKSAGSGKAKHDGAAAMDATPALRRRRPTTSGGEVLCARSDDRRNLGSAASARVAPLHLKAVRRGHPGCAASHAGGPCCHRMAG